jgi:beta-glucosidase/6-phospho-beta-glucosidase/beta-galactosidase
MVRSTIRPKLITGAKGEQVNEKGIKYYSDLIDALLAEGITPCVTIFHWDYPLALEKKYGGFISEEVVDDFVNYSKILFERLGDRVKHWITINEVSHLLSIQDTPLTASPTSFHSSRV